MSGLRHTARIVGRDAFWIPLFVVGAYTVVLFVGPPRDLVFLVVFFELVMPVIGGVLAGYLLNLEADPCLELVLTVRTPPWRVLGTRFGFVAGWVAVVSVAYMFLLRLVYLPFPVLTMFLTFAAPFAFLASLGMLFSLSVNSGVAGALAAGLWWAVQLVLPGFFLGSSWLKRLFLSATFYRFAPPAWGWNRATLLGCAGLLLVASLALAGRRERFIA